MCRRKMYHIPLVVKAERTIFAMGRETRQTTLHTKKSLMYTSNQDECRVMEYLINPQSGNRTNELTKEKKEQKNKENR